MVFLDKTPMLSWSSSSLARHSAEGRRHSRQVRHEGFAMSRHAPDRGQQLAHRRDLQHRRAPAALRFYNFLREQGSGAARYKSRLCDLAGAREPAEETEPIGEG